MPPYEPSCRTARARARSASDSAFAIADMAGNMEMVHARPGDDPRPVKAQMGVADNDHRT